jgi:hypothetical protein
MPLGDGKDGGSDAKGVNSSSKKGTKERSQEQKRRCRDWTMPLNDGNDGGSDAKGVNVSFKKGKKVGGKEGR